MKHQIVFVGGQLLPLVAGIKEFTPDKVHFIVSEESKGSITSIKSFLSNKVYTENVCNPFDFDSIKTTCEKVLNRIDLADEILFNLTGGTKIMVLAAQSLISERKLNGFYVNQNDTVLHVPSYQIKKLNAQILVREFFEISGHKMHSSKTIDDFTKDDFKTAREIEGFAISNDSLFYEINLAIRNKYNRVDRIPTSGLIEVSKAIKLSWNSSGINVERNGSKIFAIQSPNARSLFFNAVWWELIVAKEISRWPKATELLVHCELPFKTDAKARKNEIDILINLGGKLIFVECKSGLIKQEDINKMKVVKDTYGGVVSRSILVSRFKPHPTIIEKCSEVNIDLFYLYGGKSLINPLSKLIPLLDRVENKLMI